MAKFKASIIKEGLREAGWAVLRYLWPLVLPLLTAYAQYEGAIPWPYFATAFALTLAASLLMVGQLWAWYNARRLDDKVMLSLIDVVQSPMGTPTEDGLYRYGLVFRTLNIDRRFLHFRLKKLSWEIAGKSKSNVEIEDDVAVLAPGEAYPQSQTIEDIPLAPHSGKFTISIEYGRKPDEMEYEIKLFGTFLLLEAVPANKIRSVHHRWNRGKYEVNKL